MAMKVVDKVAWSEGVLLRPQHFQQLDRYHESLVAARLDAIDALNWGALHIELDERALQQGLITLSAFEGIMPDGTPRADRLAKRPVCTQTTTARTALPPAQTGVQILLAIPQERSGVTNFAEDGDQLRYSSAHAQNSGHGARRSPHRDPARAAQPGVVVRR